MLSIRNVLRRSIRTGALTVLTVMGLASSTVVGQDPPVTVVDRCVSDVEPGGINLAMALERGGNITFNCPAGTVISITRAHKVSRSFDLDGGGKVTLDGGGQQSFVEGVVPNLSIRLANITIQKMFSTNTSGVVDGDLGLKISIEGSRILDSELPIGIAQGEVVVTDSQFERNRNAALSAPVVVVARSAIRATDGQPVFSRLGSVEIADSEITDNLSGSIFRRCSTAVIMRTVFRNNREPSTSDREGGAAFKTDCDTLVENATFIDNKSSANGGAIFARGAATRITIRGSRFSGNTAQLNGGAIAIEAAVTSQRLTLQYTIFRNNGARQGGAIWLPPGTAGGHAEVVGAGLNFTGNVATERGGAIAVEGVVLGLTRAAFIRNSAAAGGAVWAVPLSGVPNVLANTLFVLTAGGGGAFEGSGTQFLNATVLGSQGAGIRLTAAAPIRLANTIVENNAGGNCLGDPVGFVNEGGNLQFPGSSCGAGISVAAALLDTFYAPMLGGAARGNGKNEICLSPPVAGRDFYGKRRPEADHCSVGAVEGDLKQTIAAIKGTTPRPPGGGQCVRESGSGCECAELPRPRSGRMGTSAAEARMASLAALGIDFSVDETELLSWMDTPEFTPYPAIAEALTGVLGEQALRCPVFIDVIVSNYEAMPGILSPRRAGDVKPDVLFAAIIEGYNNRHGTLHSSASDVQGGRMCLRSSSSPSCPSECDPDTPAMPRVLQSGAGVIDQKLAALSAVGIDFSVDETELRSWLDTPDFTPYPAVSDALLNLTRSRGLRCPVFLDVIVFNYESAPGVMSPRTLSDVEAELLQEALVTGYNLRHGTTYSSVLEILR